MGAPNVLTLICPHCEKQLRVGSEHAGWRTRCPHPDCRRPLTIPLLLDYDDEPEEAVLIAEGPPVPIPVIPRHRPRPEYAPAPSTRGIVWLWVFTAALMLTTISLTTGWAIAKALRARSAPTDPTRPARPNADEPPTPDEPTQGAITEPQPPKRSDPPRGPEAFVGRWEIVDPQLQETKLEITAEFRADGAYQLTIDNPGRPPVRSFGTWKWDGQLSLRLDGIDAARPSEVRWTGPDEFVTTNDHALTTYRRQK